MVDRIGAAGAVFSPNPKGFGVARCKQPLAKRLHRVYETTLAKPLISGQLFIPVNNVNNVAPGHLVRAYARARVESAESATLYTSFTVMNNRYIY